MSKINRNGEPRKLTDEWKRRDRERTATQAEVHRRDLAVTRDTGKVIDAMGTAPASTAKQ